MRRPVDPKYPVTGDTAAHRARNVGPATDYGVPMGTPVLAPFAGRLSWFMNGPGGKGVRLVGTHATFIGQHLSSRRAARSYAEGAQIASSGNTGTDTTGPHLHCYVVINATGQRMSMTEYLDAYAPTRNPEPYPPQKPLPKGHTMDRIFIKAKGQSEIYELKDGKKRHLSPAEWAAINDGYARAGVKLPYSKDKLSAAQIADIPTA